MRARCFNPKNSRYKNYGGRGIKVCDARLDFQTFFDYVSKPEHFGEEGYSLDRINNGVTETELLSKFRRDSFRYDVGDGRMLTMREIALEVGVSKQTIRGRIKSGWRGAKLLLPPVIRRDNK